MKLRTLPMIAVAAAVVCLTAAYAPETPAQDPSDLVFEMHPANVLRLTGSKPHRDGYVLELWTNLPRIQFGETVFEIPEPGTYRFVIPRDSTATVTRL